MGHATRSVEFRRSHIAFNINNFSTCHQKIFPAPTLVLINTSRSNTVPQDSETLRERPTDDLYSSSQAFYTMPRNKTSNPSNQACAAVTRAQARRSVIMANMRGKYADMRNPVLASDLVRGREERIAEMLIEV